MIKADHSKLAYFFYNIYINNLLKKNFSSFYIINEPPQFPDERAILITPNHISWWDGFFIERISKKYFRKKFFLLMLEKELKKIKFFSKIGAFSIDQENPKKISETFSYIKDLLKQKNNLVVFYPQGEIEDFNRRPVNIKDGIKYLIKKSDNNFFILPIGFKIHYYNKKYPDIYCKFGEIIKSEDFNFNFYIESFTKNLDELYQSSLKQNFNSKLF